ncbi:hypothetical protein ACHZ97_14495 [Lysobacter soli]|uniref:hypothetical protein n=1 Tax=Lysobacter soli TaxID=453783 RepID=UPI0037C92742
MSRSGYSDDCENIGLWRGAVSSAIRSKRGQRLLRDFVAALDAMPDKKLGRGALSDSEGCMCSLGVVAAHRQIDFSDFNAGTDNYGYAYQAHSFSDRFDIANAMAREIMFENDEGGPWDSRAETPEARWARMRAWAMDHIQEPSNA